MSSTTKESTIVDSTNTIAAVGVSDSPHHFKNWNNEAGFNAQFEQHEPVELQIRGNFPPWCAGQLLRIGPGAYRFPKTHEKDGYYTASHWFDGFSHAHKFTLEASVDTASGCKVTYQSRRQADLLLEQARKDGKLKGISFGQKRDPCDTLFAKVKSVFEPIFNNSPRMEDCGVALQRPVSTKSREKDSSGSKTFSATSDKNRTVEFNLDTLEPMGVTDQRSLHSDLDGELSSAHAAHDPVTGDIFNYNLKLGPRPVYRVFHTSASTGHTKVIATITGQDAAYLHSSLITENFYILCIWPCNFSMGGARVLWERNLLDALEFQSGKKTRWFVVDRRRGKGVVAKFTSDPFFCFHTANAWEKTNQDGTVDINAELVTYENSSILHRFYYENLTSTAKNAASSSGKKEYQGRLVRYRLPDIAVPSDVPTKTRMATRRAELVKSIPSPHAGDLPTFNPAYATKPSRYVYSVLDRGESSFADALGKTDTETGECTVWSMEGHTPGEAIFIQRPNAQSEDDGVLLSVVLNGKTETSILLCLDARTMTEIGVAEVGGAVGLGFHGTMLRAQD